ncbi:MAG: hypothetical protein AABZ55_01795 [Bdellovibrionota bacterium]
MRKTSYYYFLLSLIAHSALAESRLRSQAPHVLSFELFGRSFLYGVQYDRTVGPAWCAGMGLAKISAEGDSPSSSSGSTWVIPLFTHYYLTEQDHSPLLTAGITLLPQGPALQGRHAIQGTTVFPSVPFLATLGAGYEWRQDSGFIFRTSGFLTWGGNLAPALGIVFGQAF